MGKIHQYINKNYDATIGDLSELETLDKSNIVNAINEATNTVTVIFDDTQFEIIGYKKLNPILTNPDIYDIDSYIDAVSTEDGAIPVIKIKESVLGDSDTPGFSLDPDNFYSNSTIIVEGVEIPVVKLKLKTVNGQSLLGTGDINISTTETDPTVPSYSKSLTAFSVIKTDTDLLYEPILIHNTAFNKDFGTISGTVAEGNDSRIVNGQTAYSWGNHASAGYQESLVSGTNIKTLNGQSLLGTGDITATYVMSTATGVTSISTLSSNFSSTNTTRAAVTGWSAAVTAGKTYKLQVYATYQTAATTTGGSLGVVLTTGVGNIHGSIRGSISAAAVATELAIPLRVINTVGTTAGSFLTTTGVNAINTPHFIGLEAIFNCTTTGTLQITWGTEIAASAAQLNLGSTFLITQLN